MDGDAASVTAALVRIGVAPVAAQVLASMGHTPESLAAWGDSVRGFGDTDLTTWVVTGVPVATINEWCRYFPSFRVDCWDIPSAIVVGFWRLGVPVLGAALCARVGPTRWRPHHWLAVFAAGDAAGMSAAVVMRWLRMGVADWIDDPWSWTTDERIAALCAQVGVAEAAYWWGAGVVPSEVGFNQDVRRKVLLMASFVETAALL